MIIHMVRLPVEEMIFHDLFYVWTSKVIIMFDFLLNQNPCKSLSRGLQKTHKNHESNMRAQ